jgi:hypothetical protein
MLAASVAVLVVIGVTPSMPGRSSRDAAEQRARAEGALHPPAMGLRVANGCILVGGTHGFQARRRGHHS